MKQIISIAFIITTIFTVTTSCSDWLDLKPEGEVVLEDFWQNETQVNQILSACYKSMAENDVIGKMLVWGELRSDNVTFGNSVPDEMSKLLSVDITPKNGYNRWGSFYTIINYCNTFLHYAPDVVPLDPNFTDADLRGLEAEVLTIRSLAYFYLVRTFNKVPWVDKPSIDDTQDYELVQEDEEVILGNIIRDLLKALPNARDKFEDPRYDKGRVTKKAIRAILADIYLWQNDYDNCIKYCDQILKDEEYPLELVEGEDVISQVFYQGNSSESIFEIQFDDDNLRNSVARNFFGDYGNQSGQWCFPSQLITGFSSPFSFRVGSARESGYDLRKKDFLRQRSDKYFVFKYAGAYREEESNRTSTYYYRSNTANFILYRLSEIMLMKAEALIQKESNLETAIELINTVYIRSNPENTDDLSLDSYGSKQELEKLLLRERQRELMFEGKRWFTLMRLARREGSPTPLLGYVLIKYTGEATSQATKMSVMDALYLPIHADEIKANPALVQNPFYELTGEESN